MVMQNRRPAAFLSIMCDKPYTGMMFESPTSIVGTYHCLYTHAWRRIQFVEHDGVFGLINESRESFSICHSSRASSTIDVVQRHSANESMPICTNQPQMTGPLPPLRLREIKSMNLTNTAVDTLWYVEEEVVPQKVCFREVDHMVALCLES